MKLDETEERELNVPSFVHWIGMLVLLCALAAWIYPTFSPEARRIRGMFENLRDQEIVNITLSPGPFLPLLENELVIERGEAADQIRRSLASATPIVKNHPKTLNTTNIVVRLRNGTVQGMLTETSEDGVLFELTSEDGYVIRTYRLKDWQPVTRFIRQNR
jgi:hypothetical protein